VAGGREVDHSLPDNAEGQNEWSCSSTPPVCLTNTCMDSMQGGKEKTVRMIY